MSSLDDMLSSEPLPPSRHRSSGPKRVAILVIVLIGIAIIAGAVLMRVKPFGSADYPGPGSGSVTVEVTKGESLSSIAAALQDADVVASAEAFLSAAGANPKSSSIGPGQYALLRRMSGAGALELMLSPSSRPASRLVLPEGLTLDETVSASAKFTGIAKSEFRAALKDAAALGLPAWADGHPEGLMYPATYDVATDVTAAALLHEYVARFEQAAGDLSLVKRAKALGRTPYEVLTIASLLQAEGTPNDFAKIARVIYNRLDSGMPLQLDSTVAYGLGISRLQLTAEELKSEGPYNSYVNKGVPPTPINSPGSAAIEAALAPAQGKWLYFVTVNPDTKETKFAKGYDKFLQLKREYQDYLASKGKP